MKIRQIALRGFKSFADRTQFEFDGGISAIVGPNGCGKSNVVDAIKWVLGDMSPRSLRGKRMEDVIFAGSRHRRPANVAEVTLLLDNADGRLPSEHTEVSITRRLHRAGQSEYLLNGQVARLRDIRELFLDTGLGGDGAAIMEQGQIDAILAANPQDRRGIFEEAAGVSRYKQRRKETEQRLVRTRDNLERLRDVLELEEKRVRSLKNQASRARRYQALRDELSRKRVLRAVLRYRGVSREREALQEELRTATAREREAAEELAALEQRALEATRAREAAREAVHGLESRIARAASDARAARDRAEFAARTRRDLEGRIETARRQGGRARERMDEIAAEVRALAAEAAEADRQAEEEDGRLEAAETDLAGVEREAGRVRDGQEETKREVLAALGRISEVRNEEAEAGAEIRQAGERLGRLAAQRAELEAQAERIGREARDLEALAARLEAEGQEMSAALRDAEVRHEEARRLLEETRAARVACSEERASCLARIDVLERLTAAGEGLDEGARMVLEAVRDREPAADGSRDGVLGVLADLIRPETAGAAVLDRLLGPGAGAVVVGSTDDALRWIDWLRGRRATARVRFLCLDLVRGSAPPLPEDVRLPGCDPRLAALVASVAAGTILVRDLPSGVQAWNERGVNAVTPRGDRVTASGALLGGADGRGLGLVERGAEMRRLSREVARLDGVLEGHGRALAGAQERLVCSEAEVRRIRAALATHGEDRSRRGEALARSEEERARVGETLEVLASEASEVEERLSALKAGAAALAGRRESLEEDRRRLEACARAAAEEGRSLEVRQREAGERRMQIRLAATAARARADAARGRRERAEHESGTLAERAEALGREVEELKGRRDRSEVEIAEAEAKARQGEAECGRAGKELLEARARLERLEQEAGGEAERRTEVQRLYEGLREDLERYRLRDSELRVRMEALVDQVRQDLGLDLEAASREGESPEEVDFEAVEQEVEDLRRRMEGLGNVNLNAIAELEDVEQHVAFLRGQEKDLLDAAADLEKVIQNLDRISTSRFAETFERIRGHFRETFRRLFGGGRAEIVLEDAANLLESGVDIVARPPGKEQRTISLLSGGERTLTAVALLFAVFQAKPSPFAVLDEVDAALDEANVRRLVNLVREFTDRSQFLVVTHAKTTMESADLLYGVTMEEPGVSKQVAVRLTDFVSEAAVAS